MTSSTTDHDVLDDGFRPIEDFTLARQNAVRNLANALIDNHGFTDGGALAVAQAVADPTAVRKQLAVPDEISVFGGTLLTVTSRISVLAAVPHVTNGRVIGATPYPASDAATVAAPSKYWPERDLASPSGSELVLAGGSRSRVVSALEAADAELLAQNDWEESIRMNGVFAPVTAAVLKIETEDAPPAWVLSAVDGSSRVASCHRILGLDPSDPVYGTVSEPRVARGRLQQIMSVLHRSREDVDPADLGRARAATLPATIVIGFRPDHAGRADLVDALDEYVALLHLEPPTPWAGPARDNKIADSVIDALRDVNVLDDRKALWYAGMLSRADAGATGLSVHPDERGADILKTLTADAGSDAGYAIGLGIRRRTLRQRVRRGPKAEVAASLAMRTYATANINRRRVATTLVQHVYQLEDFWSASWAVTGRDVDDVLDAALDELAGKSSGASGLELAALASYHLTVHGALGTEEPGSGEITDSRTGLTRAVDKREPRAVIASMLLTEHGLRSLHRAIVDGRAGREPQQINPDGTLAVNANGEQIGAMTNFWLRTEFRDGPTATTQNEPSPTPRHVYLRAVAAFRAAVDEAVDARTALESVTNESGVSLADTEGIDEPTAHELRTKLGDLVDSVTVYRSTWNRRHPRPNGVEPTEDETLVEEDGL